MKSGKFEANLVNGEVELKYNVAGEEAPQFVKIIAPVAPLAVPVLEAAEAKILSGEIDIVKGVDFDKEIALKVIAALKLALA